MEYTSQAGEWHQVEVSAGVAPEIGWRPSLVIRQESLYIFNRFNYPESGTSLFRFHIPAKRWSVVLCAGTIPSSEYGHSAVIRRDEMYLFGGWCEISGNLCDLFCFNFKKSTWNHIHRHSAQEWAPNGDPHPLARAGHIMATNDDFLFVFGGCIETCYMKNNAFTFPPPKVNDMYEYSYESCLWTVTEQKGELPPPRIFAGSCTHEDSVYVYGGSGTNQRFLGDFHVFTMESRTWAKILPLGQAPPPLFGLSCVSHANSVYIFGGKSVGGKINDLYEYKLGSNTWIQITADQPSTPPKESLCGMQIYKNSIYILGCDTLLYEFRLQIRRTSTSTYKEDMRSLVYGPEHADVKLLVGGEEINVNKAILCARSNYFRSLLDKAGMKESLAGKHEAIEIFDATASTFRLILDYVALDTVPADIDFETALDLLALGDKYRMDRLVDLCEEIIETNLSVDNVVECLISAHNTGRGADGVKEMCKRLIGNNMKKVKDVAPDLPRQLEKKPDLLFEISQLIWDLWRS